MKRQDKRSTPNVKVAERCKHVVSKSQTAHHMTEAETGITSKTARTHTTGQEPSAHLAERPSSSSGWDTIVLL